MSSGQGGGGMMAEINVTPLVDVMLVLLIIFMVAAPMLQVVVPVTLPKADAQAIPDDQAKRIITVPKEFDTDGTVYIVKTPFKLACGVESALDDDAKLQSGP